MCSISIARVEEKKKRKKKNYTRKKKSHVRIYKEKNKISRMKSINSTFPQ